MTRHFEANILRLKMNKHGKSSIIAGFEKGTSQALEMEECMERRKVSKDDLARVVR